MTRAKLEEHVQDKHEKHTFDVRRFLATTLWLIQSIHFGMLLEIVSL
jgi:hypothetical protein